MKCMRMVTMAENNALFTADQSAGATAANSKPAASKLTDITASEQSGKPAAKNREHVTLGQPNKTVGTVRGTTSYRTS